MVIDLVILGLALFFGIIGAFQGVSKQIAHLVALVVAVVFSRPAGAAIGPRLAESLNAPEVVGVVAGTFLAFILLLVGVRYVLAAVIKKLLEGKKPEDQSLDRGLGFAFASFKVLAVAYVVLSALTFAEQQITITGRKMGFTPRDSLTFEFARSYNLFTLVHFAPVRDFAELARALSNPDQAAELKKAAAYKALAEDPRFRKALASREVQEAIKTGDLQALLKSDAVLNVVRDEELAGRLKAAAQIADAR